MRVSELYKYRLQNSLHIGQDLVVPKADHSEALPSQVLLPLSIGSSVCRVLATVKLDDQMPLDTTKVDKKWADGVLTAKFGAVQMPISQPHPHFPLGICSVPPQAARQQRVYPLPHVERRALQALAATLTQTLSLERKGEGSNKSPDHYEKQRAPRGCLPTAAYSGRYGP